MVIHRVVASAILVQLMFVCSSLCLAMKLLGEVRRIEALLGGKITLPCDVTPAHTNDSLLLLVWYKGDKPFYSYDARLLKHWRSDDFFQNDRIMFSFHAEPASLLMDRVNLDDEGLYRCRADFTLSPTRNIGIYLFVIIVPSKPFFMDEIGTKVENTVGPYHEGDTLLLSCMAVGGKPTPKLTWWRSSTLLDSTDEPSEVPGVRENQLLLVLTREYSGAKIQCLASNNNITVPLSSTLEIELYVSPETVMILSSKQALSAGESYTLPCYVNGSHPLPEVGWWLDGRVVTNQIIETQMKNNNEIISNLHFTPRIDHNGKDLTCRATNGVMAPNVASKSHTIKLDIFFAPVLTLTLLKDKDRDYIVEGDNVHLRCMAEANPWITNTEWFGNNETIRGSVLNGSQITITTSDLLIFNVSSRHAGNYSCKAFNLEGAGKSNDLAIQIYYKPQCVTNDTIELINVKTLSCPVKSSPESDTFFWEISSKNPNTDRNMKFPFYKNSIDLTTLTDNFTKYLRADAVDLLCWASNQIGEQAIPCNIVLRQTARLPESPRECKIYTSEFTVTVKCRQDESTLDRLFVAAVWELINGTKALIANITTPFSKVNVDNLNSGKSYEILFYAYNRWGKSEGVTLMANTLESSKLLESGVMSDIGLWCGVCVGAFLTLLLLIFIIIYKRRKRKCKSVKKDENKNERKGKQTQNKSVKADITTKPLLDRNGISPSSNLSKTNCEPKNSESQNLVVQDKLAEEESSPPQPPPFVNRSNKPKVPISNGCAHSNGDIEINNRPRIKLKRPTKEVKLVKELNNEVEEYVICETPNIKMINMSRESIV